LKKVNVFAYLFLNLYQIFLSIIKMCVKWQPEHDRARVLSYLPSK
jgi:hypothetical protein